MNIQKTVCISYPRSGHGLLADLILEYFSFSFDYCEYYHHCQTFPCSNPETKLMKNHDFELNIPIVDNVKYIIQLRHPYLSILSWYQLERKKDAMSKEDFLTFFEENLIFWEKFYNKWLIMNKSNIHYVLLYHNLMDNPFKELSNIIQLMTDIPHVIDEEKLSNIIKKANIVERNIPYLFDYFDINHLQKIEEKYRDLLKKIGIPLIFKKLKKGEKKIKKNPLYPILKTTKQKEEQERLYVQKLLREIRKLKGLE